MRTRTNPLSEKVGMNILVLSRKKGISQKELAATVGMTEGMLSQVMRGKKAMPLERLSKIAKALGVTPDKLLK